MNSEVLQALQREAAKKGMTVESEMFAARIDRYIEQYFSARRKEAKIIEVYFADAALKIALLEKKASIGLDDAKAAVFMFCKPTSIDSTCRTAGENALRHFSGDIEAVKGAAEASQDAMRAITLYPEFAQLLTQQRGNEGL